MLTGKTIYMVVRLGFSTIYTSFVYSTLEKANEVANRKNKLFESLGYKYSVKEVIIDEKG